MTLSEYIGLKLVELWNTGLYRQVDFERAIDITMRKNVRSENFIPEDSDKERNIIDDLSSLVDEDREGSKVTFEVVKKGKRKPEVKTFYVLYT